MEGNEGAPPVATDLMYFVILPLLDDHSKNARAVWRLLLLQPKKEPPSFFSKYTLFFFWCCCWCTNQSDTRPLDMSLSWCELRKLWEIKKKNYIFLRMWKIAAFHPKASKCCWHEKYEVYSKANQNRKWEDERCEAWLLIIQTVPVSSADEAGSLRKSQDLMGWI